MNWENTDDNWIHFTGAANERWNNLTGDQLTGRIQDMYGATDLEDDTQRELTDWQQRLREIERAAQLKRRTIAVRAASAMHDA